MELETNATKGLARENSLMLQRGPLAETAAMKMAQTFRSGTNDIDAIDYVEMFLDDQQQNQSRPPERPVRAGQLPPGADQEELADGLRRGRLRQHLRPAAFLSDPAALRGLHLSAVDPAGGRGRRPRRCRPAPHQEQLHAQPAGRRDLQRGAGQPPEAEDQVHRHPDGRPEHRSSTTRAR